MNEINAVIFDMDGVIVDSEAQWRIAEFDFFRAHAPSWRDEHHEKIVGMGVEDTYFFLKNDFGLKLGKVEFLEHCETLARKVYLERVDCAAGFLDLTRHLKHKGLKTGIASSSPERWIKIVVERFSLSPLIDTIISADDVGGNTKPKPDIYLEAAARLGLPTKQCLAIEDSSIGLLSAKRAGLRCIGLRTKHNTAQDLGLAEFELSGFVNLTLEKLLTRLDQ